MRKALQQYQAVNLESDIASASPYRITQMLLEGCLRFMKQAQIAIQKNDIERKGTFIAKSQAIIVTLAGSMDREVSPELTDNLALLYDFALDQLLQASTEMDAQKIEGAIKVVKEIKEGWDAIPPASIAEAESRRAEKS